MKKKDTDAVELRRRHKRVNTATGEVEEWTDIRDAEGFVARLVKIPEENYSRAFSAVFLEELDAFLETDPTSTEMKIFLKLLTKMGFANEIVTTRSAFAKECRLSRQAVVTAFQKLEEKKVIVTRQERSNSTLREVISIPLADADRFNFNLVWNGKPGINNYLVRRNVHPHVAIGQLRVNNTQVNNTSIHIERLDNLNVVVVTDSKDASGIDLKAIKGAISDAGIRLPGEAEEGDAEESPERGDLRAFEGSDE